jgi:hypothetical protein
MKILFNFVLVQLLLHLFQALPTNEYKVRQHFFAAVTIAWRPEVTICSLTTSGGARQRH